MARHHRSAVLAKTELAELKARAQKQEGDDHV